MRLLAKASRFEACALAWCALLLLVGAGGCSRAGGSPETEATAAQHLEAAPGAPDTPSGKLVARLEGLRKSGQLAAFIDAALEVDLAQHDAKPADASAANSPGVALQLLKTEALAALGRNQAAEEAALGAARRALDVSNPALASQALKLWVMARLRQGKPLEEPRFADLLAALPPADPGVQTLRFWHQAFLRRAPYRLDPAARRDPTPIEIAESASGSVGHELNAISVRANSVSLPLVFIDTGSQHNLMTVDAARAAGVTTGTSDTQLIGFAGHNARPGIVKTLELGDMRLFDVPVLVGNTQQLAALDGQMALGIELMHHVRLTLDYPERLVFAQPADAPPPADCSQRLWEIPVWTFSQACLVQGQLATGAQARVLVDTGDRAGTYVSSRWARRNVPRFARVGPPLVFKFKPRDWTIAALELGNESLLDWPVIDMMPDGLERLDLVDVLVGHDLLRRFQLTIDLKERVLQLCGAPPPSAVDARRIDDARTSQGVPDEEN